MVAITETNDPKLDTKFQPAYESGKSGILLGIPANPKKCCYSLNFSLIFKRFITKAINFTIMRVFSF